MQLKSISYSQHDNSPSRWAISGLDLGNVNLIVGKNASGKSWSTTIIKGLAAIVSGENKISFKFGNYTATFDNDGQTIVYALEVADAVVKKESFSVDGKMLMQRSEGGFGEIYYSKDARSLEFQCPPNELACVARLDSVQHPFLQHLHSWGTSLFYYPFGTSLGKDSAVILAPEAPTLNPKDANSVIGIFRRGQKDFGQEFHSAVIGDMCAIGYDLEEVGTQAPKNIILGPSTPASALVMMYAKERDLSGPTEQTEMSQGMFRALSLVIQLNYAALALKPGCIVIDDIGEGLDFERSCLLIEVLVNKATKSGVQLIMATNDRFVMNYVPLESWTILVRAKGGSRVINYKNSSHRFDEFKFTGLKNFDFMATNFFEEEA